MLSDEEYQAFLKELGKRIRDVRKMKGYSLRDMVILHGYHDSQWRKYEAGSGLNVKSLLRIAEMFRTSLSHLLNGLGEFPEESLPEITKKRVAAKRKPAK